MAMSTYPVHVDGNLEPRLSRGLWLVKWLLAIPHYIVLFFLWAAFVVLSIVAFVAILFTGRYPRALFDFNVGVLRWTWRVNYYSYGALGTDRYPPFTLGEAPDYPAHLTIDYPEHLSRGLVLVKWWLLAIPHYLIVGFFVGGTTYVVTQAGDQVRSVSNPGLIGLLVIFAGIALLFTGRYPQPVFDLVLGMNRWVLRVAAYAGLMTDRYPPFRLDQGGADPDAGQLMMSTPAPPMDTAPVPPSAPSATPAPGAGGPSAPRWTAGRVVAVVVGSVLVLGSLGLGLGGTALLVADRTMRDSGGFLMSGTQDFTTSAYAISTPNVEIHTDLATDVPHALLGDAKVEATSRTDAPVFIGVARTADAEAYLRDVRHAVLVDWRDSPVLDTRGTGAPTTPPTGEDFWVTQASGSGTQSVTWPLKSGDWTVVVMNADASAQVGTDVAAGATVPALNDVLIGALIGALVGLVVGVVLVSVGVQAASRAR